MRYKADILVTVVIDSDSETIARWDASSIGSRIAVEYTRVLKVLKTEHSALSLESVKVVSVKES